MKRQVCLLALLISAASAHAQPTLAERLGYPADAKLLIIHADDLGVAHAENQASFEAMQSGVVNSASIMVPCPWLPEVAEFARKHPDFDLGLHLTLTSEWRHMKWSPVSGANAGGGLVDSAGYLFDGCAGFAAGANLEAVERELRAQIARAQALGIRPTHLDSHMGCLFFTRPEFFDIYLRLGRELQIPAMVSRDFLAIASPEFQKLLAPQDLVVDRVITAVPENFAQGMAAFYENTLRNLAPGVNVLLIHTAYDNAETQGMTIDHPDWGAAWRQLDFNFFTSQQARALLQSADIQLVTWRQVGQLLQK